MKPNPISFLLLSMVLGMTVLALVLLAVLSIRIDMVSAYTTSTIPADGVESVSVRNIVGSITIIGEERSDILLKTEEETIFGMRVLDRVYLEVDPGPNVSIRISSDLDLPLFNVHMNVWVPKDIPLGKVRMDHGNMKVSGVASVGHCSLDNGLIEIRDVKDIGDLELGNGDIEASGQGWTDGASVDNGNIFVHMGNISLGGSAFNAVNGDITIEVPSDLPMAFDLEVTTGHVGIEDLSPDYDREGGGHLSGSLNGGGPLLEADLVNGNLVLRGYGSEVGS